MGGRRHIFRVEGGSLLSILSLLAFLHTFYLLSRSQKKWLIEWRGCIQYNEDAYNTMERLKREFLCEGSGKGKKDQWVRWEMVSQPKNRGDL